MLQHINVQFALLGKAGQREVAAAHKTSDGIVGVLPMQQIKLGVQRVAQIDLDDQFLRPNLIGQLA
jgi:hypothetical protein